MLLICFFVCLFVCLFSSLLLFFAPAVVGSVVDDGFFVFVFCILSHMQIYAGRQPQFYADHVQQLTTVASTTAATIAPAVAF